MKSREWLSGLFSTWFIRPLKRIHLASFLALSFFALSPIVLHLRYTVYFINMPTPVFVNPPPSHFQFVDKKYHNHDPQQYDHLFLSSHNLPPCDPTFFNTTHQDQRSIQHQASQQHQFKVHQHLSHHRSSDEQGLSPSSSHRPDTYNGNQSACKREVIRDGSSKSENGSATKWMSSKMRLMQKMTNSNCIGTKESKKIKQQLQYEGSNEINSFNNNKNTVRVCSDCNTTTTPLWRSGPRGPKSLCNACGIRQRKVRKAMEAVAGNGTTAVTTDTGCTKIKIQHNKQKKSRTSHVVQHKKQCKPQDHPPTDRMISRRNLCFNDFALGLSKNSTALKQVFPQDVKDAAVLLMELSCGFIQR